MLVRYRVEDDLAALEGLPELVHHRDGYPAYLFGDLRDFVASPDALSAWAAETEGQIEGHVALHSSSWDGVMRLGRDATGLSDDDLAVIARLLVSPTARRQCVGRALLETATTHAWQLGLRSILDVIATYTAAIRLYEDTGWTRRRRARLPQPTPQYARSTRMIRPLRPRSNANRPENTGTEATENYP